MRKIEKVEDENYLKDFIKFFYMIHANSTASVINLDRIYIAVTEKFADIYSLSREDIIGKSMREVCIDKYEIDNPTESFQIGYKPIINPDTNNNLGRLMEISPIPELTFEL